LIEPAFDADRSDWKIVERGIVNPFDATIPGCNVSGRECPFRFHPPGDQYSQPQTNSFVVVIVLDNRLVAAELERRWEESLRALREAEDSMRRQAETEAKNFHLDSKLKQALLDVGRCLTELWESGLISRAQKKALSRCLIDKVLIQRAVRDCVRTRIVWRGGADSLLEIPIAVGAFSVSLWWAGVRSRKKCNTRARQTVTTSPYLLHLEKGSPIGPLTYLMSVTMPR